MTCQTLRKTVSTGCTNRTFIYFCVSLHHMLLFSGRDTTIACNAVVKTITIKTLYLRVQNPQAKLHVVLIEVFTTPQDIFWERFQAHFLKTFVFAGGKKRFWLHHIFHFFIFYFFKIFFSMLIFFLWPQIFFWERRGRVPADFEALLL